MMNSVSGVSVQKAAAVLKTQQQSHYDTVANTPSKDANLKFGLALSHTPPQRSNKTAGEDQLVTGVQYPSSFSSVDKEEPRETLASTSSPALLPLSPTSSSPDSTSQSSIQSQMPNVTFPYNLSTIAKFQRTKLRNLLTNTTSTPPLLFPSLSRRPVCPYPPVPTHGTFYFRNVENPGPRAYRHYIQYACYPGYTLAHGAVHSFCQEGATWSGITPVCLELTPCSVNNGGCSQLCSHSQHLNQSSNQTQLRAQCHCRPGFTLLDDGQTCRDLDECADGQHQCHQRCINTFGSFKCGCDDGYHPAPDQTSCLDINECQEQKCEWQCINLLGSHRCICPRGYTLHRDGQRCQDINECSQRNGGCSNLCVNRRGGYKCACPASHRLSPYSWKKCVQRATATTAG
nr:PREDICTED: fibrillin-1-like [Paralichthys olivaceus]